MFADLHVVPDLDQVINFRPFADDCRLECPAINRHVRADFDVVADDDVADLRHLTMRAAIEHVAEAVRANYRSGVNPHALAAIAGRTRRIRLGTAVTVLSTDDPVRAFQRFSTLNAVSNGRAEAIVGRGSFSESYPLFGFAMNDYDRLFEEHQVLLASLVRQPEVTWPGQTRSGLTKARL